jgi:hypothetical protein
VCGIPVLFDGGELYLVVVGESVEEDEGTATDTLLTSLGASAGLMP